MADRPALDGTAGGASRAARRRLRHGALCLVLAVVSYSVPYSAPCGVLAVSACGLMAMTACGGAAKQMKVTPITPEQERVFDHGVDFVAALQGLEGRWREGWDHDLGERVAGADYIGVVHIDALLTETDPEQQVTHRLRSRIKRSLYGDLKELQLRVTAGQPGFGSVHDNLQRIQGRDFVAYVKWYVDSEGEPAAHFHLSPASEAVVGETERVVVLRGKAQAPQERVVVHNN